MGFESADSMDPVLEIWVDGDRPVVTIRLVGILDRTTRDRLLSVMDELVTEGIESFVMDMGEAEIFGASGAAALALLQRLVREAGRTLLWEGVDFDKPTWGAPP
jgi:anti-anti-sigma regulatory factor